MTDHPIITTYTIQREKEHMQEMLDTAPIPTIIIFGIAILYILILSIYDTIRNRKLTPEEQKQQREQRKKDFDDLCR